MAISNRKKFYSSEVLDEAVQEIADLTADDEASLVLIGGYAMQLYGSDRMTGDIDILTNGEQPLSLPRHGTLAIGGIRSSALNGVPVDILFSDTEDTEVSALYDGAIDEAVAMKGIALPVVTAEYLAVLKMDAGRRKDELDLHFLITEGVLDIPKTEHLIRKHLGRFALRDFRQTVEIAKLEKKRR